MSNFPGNLLKNLNTFMVVHSKQMYNCPEVLMLPVPVCPVNNEWTVLMLTLSIGLEGGCHHLTF